MTHYLLNDRSDNPSRSLSFALLVLMLILAVPASIFFLSPKEAKAVTTTYYVDCNAADDTGDGLTTGTAWKTIAKVNATLTGDQSDTSVLFKRGCTWREQLTVPGSGTSGHPFTFGVYGTGAKPIFNQADSVSTLTQYYGGTEKLTNGSMESGSPPSSWTAITPATFTSVSATRPGGTGTKSGSLNCTTSCGWYVYQNISTSIGVSYRISGWMKNAVGTHGYLQKVDSDWGSNVVGSQWTTDDGRWTYLTVTFTATDVTTVIMAGGDTGGTRTYYVDDLSVQPLTSPVANIWKSTIATHPYVVMFNSNQYGHQQPSVDKLAHDYDWFWGDGSLYVYAPSDPSGYYTSVEAAKRNIGITNSKSYVTFDSLEVRNANQYGFWFGGNQSHNTLTNMVVQNSRLYNYTPQSGDTITDILLEGNYSGHAGGTGYTLTNQQRWTIRGCTSYRDGIISYDYDDTGWDALKWASGFGTYGPNNQDNVFENNEVSYTGIRDDGYMPDPVNKGFGIWLDTNWVDPGHDIIVRYNKVYDNAASGLFSEKSRYTHWYGNVSYSNGTNGLMVDTDQNGDAGAHISRDNTYYNNTLYGNSVGLYVSGGWAQDAIYIRDNIFKNNIATGNTTRQLLAKWGGENTGTVGIGNIYDHNSFGLASANFIEWGEGVYKSTYSAWETAYGGTTNSVQTDPLLTNPGANFFTLQSTSPAINGGTNLGDTYKLGLHPNSVWSSSVNTLDQTLYGTGWEMGAYVYPEVAPLPIGGGALMKRTTPSSSGSNGTTSTTLSPVPPVATTTRARCLIPATPTLTNDISLPSFVNLLITLGLIKEDKIATACAALVSNATTTHTTFTRPLKQGDRGDDVKRLQQFLNAHGFSIATTGPGSPGNETNYFGLATKRAVVQFQTMYRSDILAPVGLNTATGYFGLSSIKKVNQLLGE